MKIKELIEELSEHDPDMDVKVEYSFLPPCNCGPEDYCYCSYETRREGFYIVVEKHDIDGKKLKQSEIVFKT